MKPTNQNLIKQINDQKIPQDSICLWYLGQSGFVLKYQNIIIYLDPYLSDELEKLSKGRPDEHIRRYLPPLQINDIVNADMVFCSHDHYDHLDRGALPTISQKSPKCIFVIPPIAKQTLENLGIDKNKIMTVDVDYEHKSGDLSFVSIPAAHEKLDKSDNFGFHYRGYIIKAGSISVYHAGDSIVYDGLIERLIKHKVDICLLPINGRDWFRAQRDIPGNMNYREAVELTVASGIDLLIPMHFGMHIANTENPGYLASYLHEKYPFQKFHIMVPGENIFYMKNHTRSICLS